MEFVFVGLHEIKNSETNTQLKSVETFQLKMFTFVCKNLKNKSSVKVSSMIDTPLFYI